MDELIKICPSCGAEYLNHVQTCADCGCGLVFPDSACRATGRAVLSPGAAAPVTDNGAGTVTGGPAPPHQAGELALVRVAELDWARRLGSRLERAGIPHHLVLHAPPGCKSCGPPRFGVFVQPEDLTRAMAADADQLRLEIPDLAEHADQAAAYGGDPDACPACGSACPPGRSECPSCGLALTAAGVQCGRCGHTSPADAPACPRCGLSFDEEAALDE